METSFRDWLLKTELVNPGEPEQAQDMASMIRKSGGAAMLTGTAPPKPWDGPGGVGTPKPATTKPWTHNLKRRIMPITPTAGFMAKPPAMA